MLTKISIKQINFKMEEDHTVVKVNFTSNSSDPSLGTYRINKFPTARAIDELVREEINTVNFFSWPQGDHKPNMLPIDYRLLNEVADYVCDLGASNYRMANDGVLFHNIWQRTKTRFKSEDIVLGEREADTIKLILKVCADHVPQSEIKKEKYYEVKEILTTQLILLRFKL